MKLRHFFSACFFLKKKEKTSRKYSASFFREWQESDFEFKHSNE